MPSNDNKCKSAKFLHFINNVFESRVHDERSSNYFELVDIDSRKRFEQHRSTIFETLFVLAFNSLNRFNDRVITDLIELDEPSDPNSNGCVKPVDTHECEHRSKGVPCREINIASTTNKVDGLPTYDYDNSDLSSSAHLLYDDIEREIPQSLTLIQSDINELHYSGNIDTDEAILTPIHSSTVVPQSFGVEPDRAESSGVQHALNFEHDVHPFQKTQHDTDNHKEYPNQDLRPYIMAIQGIKTSADRGKNILPKVRFPGHFMDEQQPLHLRIAIVRDMQVDHQRRLYIYQHMQFLPHGLNEISDAKNPITLTFESPLVKTNRTVELPLRLINISSKSTSWRSRKKLFYRLDETVAANLHQTSYDPRFFRLACTIVKNNVIQWDTLCLSDYIRPKQHLHTMNRRNIDDNHSTV